MGEWHRRRKKKYRVVVTETDTTRGALYARAAFVVIGLAALVLGVVYAFWQLLALLPPQPPA